MSWARKYFIHGCWISHAAWKRVRAWLQAYPDLTLCWWSKPGNAGCSIKSERWYESSLTKTKHTRETLAVAEWDRFLLNTDSQVMKNLTADSMDENKPLLMEHFLDSLNDYSSFVLQLSKKKLPGSDQKVKAATPTAAVGWWYVWAHLISDIKGGTPASPWGLLNRQTQDASRGCMQIWKH